MGVRTYSKNYKVILPRKLTSKTEHKAPIEVSQGTTYKGLLEEYAPPALKNALGVRVNDSFIDLSRKIEHSGEIQILTFEDEAGKDIFWHSSAHVLAQAVKRRYPKAQLTVGPVIKKGPGFFYYDIQLDEKITEDDFEKLEKEMHKICEESHPVSRHVYQRQEAIDKFNHIGEHFKARIIASIPGSEEITVYRQGEFQDLCRGPHVPSTNVLGYFKLTAVSGAYWKGDPTRPMLQRLYGVSFPTEKELRKYLRNIEEAKKRDHRKLGKELKLFSFEEFAPGMVFYHANGTILFNILSEYIREECRQRGYEEVRTPSMMSGELWVRSGHYEHFKENMYFTEVEGKEFAVKPMNCPGANLIYKSKMLSYRDLPLRMAELGLVHRHELSGVLHGLFRVRAFTQDDAHIYCTPEQLRDEVRSAIQFTIDVYKKFGFSEVETFIATRPEKALGSEDIWHKATEDLALALQKEKLDFKVKEGEGAFYGPKIEFNIRDCLGRNWQCGTIQLDFFLPERFALEYTGSDGAKHRPVMLHRAILGSLERFLGILIEHYAGKFPLWLAPVQVGILTVNEAQNEYACRIDERLKAEGIRTKPDLRNEKIGYKVRQWNQQKVNYAIILGKNEEEKQNLSIRERGSKETHSTTIEEFLRLFI